MIHSTQRAIALRSVYRQFEPLNGAFHWYEAGPVDAPPVILLHGFMAHSMAFRRVAAQLSQDYRLIIPDLPAHGRDRTFRASVVEPTIESLAAWFSIFLENVAPEATLIGHSLGATVCYEFSQNYEGDNPVVLVSPGLRLPNMRFAKTALSLLPPKVTRLGFNRLGVKLIEPTQWKGEPMDRFEMTAYLQPLRQTDRMKFMLELGVNLVTTADRTGDVRPLSVDSLLVWGSEDHVIPVEHGLALKERMPGTDLHIIEGSGHSPMEDRPEKFAEVFLDFMDHR